MIPSVNQFPEFVADQLLMADDLNNLFGYLEEQERLTRTTMIGIGIICGLQVKTSTDGTKLTITRGAGDTSEGYLIRLENETFFEYKDFDPVHPKFYESFVTTTVESTGAIKGVKKFPLWELFSKSETDAKPLSLQFLSNKVVLLFYELLEIDAKNCNPVSCDDKGRDVQVTVRKLLITKEDAEKLLPKESDEPIRIRTIGNIRAGDLDVNLGSTREIFRLGTISAGAEDVLLRTLSLPDLSLKRFDVPATNLVDTNDVFEAFQRILNKNFIDSVAAALDQLHKVYRTLVSDLVAGSPFANFSNIFSFVHDGTINGNNLLHFQYYYDFFSDIIQAYNELRGLGLKIFGQCCPDPSLFPRHLLLGEAIPLPDQVRSRYRSYFIPSPLLNNQGDLLFSFRWLYQRLVLIIQKISIPVPVIAEKDNVDSNIRITPSRLGDFPLSEKSLPYYYHVNDGNGRLYLYWNPELNRSGRADQVLSYQASRYNTTDDFVLNPLRYEIEPYNFFRVEGHIGKNYKNVVAAINSLRSVNRLPFDVVALSASRNDGEIDFTKTQCHFNDLEALYDAFRAELICFLCKEMIYYYAFTPSTDNLPDTKDTIPQVPLLKFCSPNFRYAPKTLGHEFEQLYATIKNLNDIDVSLFKGAERFAAFSPFILRKVLLFYMQKVYEQLGDSLAGLNHQAFNLYFGKLTAIAQYLRNILKQALDTQTEHAAQVTLEDEIDHLDALLYFCTLKTFEAIFAEYQSRVKQLAGLRQLSNFINKHPGIEHKAGVPKGGTFIIVYYEKQKTVPRATREEVRTLDPLVELMNAGRREIISNLAEAPGTTASSPLTERTAAATRGIDQITNELADLGIKEELINAIRDNVRRRPRTGLFDAKIADYKDGTVVADFYLPYLCCSDCPPIQYIITEPNVVLSLSLDKNEFCSDDGTKYVFKATPEGGEVTGENVVKEENKFSFNPSAVNFGDAKQKTIVFTYTYQDKTATFSITIYRKPTADFEAKQGTASNREFLFTNKSKFGTLYQWDFGESGDPGSTKEQPDPHVYRDEGNYTVTLKVTNGVCSSTVSKIITVVPLGAVSINLDKAEFCSDEKGPFNFTVAPAGGKVTGEGVKEISTGVFAFIPSDVDVANVENKTVALTYTATDARTALFNAVVYHRPAQPKFTFARSGSTNTITFNVTDHPFGNSFKWDFGDGQTLATAELQVAHTYLQNGVFSVRLVSINKVCTSEPAVVQVPVERVIVVSKTCLPLDNVVKDFEALSRVDPNGFPGFSRALASFREITAYFGSAKTHVSDAGPDQLKFFIDSKTDTLLAKWLPETAALFNSDFRTLALALHRIFVNLSMLVACVKNEDLNGVPPQLTEVFRVIATHLRTIGGFAAQLNPSQKQIMLALQHDLTEEVARIQANNENKPNYKAAITQMSDLVKRIVT